MWDALALPSALCSRHSGLCSGFRNVPSHAHGLCRGFTFSPQTYLFHLSFSASYLPSSTVGCVVAHLLESEVEQCLRGLVRCVVIILVRVAWGWTRQKRNITKVPTSAATPLSSANNHSARTHTHTHTHTRAHPSYPCRRMRKSCAPNSWVWWPESECRPRPRF